jgi:hypothetical protein
MRQAQATLKTAESLDSYELASSSCPINSKARTFCQYIAWQDQSLSEKAVASAAAAKAESKDITVVILSPSAEGGMPHTRAPNVICLPAYFPEERLAETMEHELVHIDQRKNPQAWREKLAAHGWTPASREEIPQQWRSRVRINPDTHTAQFWKWAGRYIPLPLFEREDKPVLREISVRWWDTLDQRLNSLPPTSFTQKYGSLGASSMEHPYELYAYHNR